MTQYRFRQIQPEDNTALHRLILEVVREHGIEAEGYLTDDSELRDIYSQYQEPGSDYWVIEDMADGGRVVGGGGYAPLLNSPRQERICEIQKMYFLAECRGQGLGKAMIKRITKAAREYGYRMLYAETHPELKGAIELYKKSGFVMLQKRLGDTGHTVCTVHMACPVLRLSGQG